MDSTQSDSTQPAVRVLIADEHQELDGGFSELIRAENDMDLVGEVVDGSQILPMARQLVPDVLLLDLTMTGGGLRALEQLCAVQPQTRIIVLALHEDISLLRSVLATRSLGYVVHRKSREELLSVIRKVFAGRGYVEVPTGGLQLDPALDPRSETRQRMAEKMDVLSKREREVLRAVAYGYTNREIAERLGISVKSIETYRYRVAEKLGFKSRADLVRFALEAGLLQTGAEGLPEV